MINFDDVYSYYLSGCKLRELREGSTKERSYEVLEVQTDFEAMCLLGLGDPEKNNVFFRVLREYANKLTYLPSKNQKQ